MAAAAYREEVGKDLWFAPSRGGQLRIKVTDQIRSPNNKECFMGYVPQWERLPDALKRLMAATGLPKDEVQADICQAIADGAVEIQCGLKMHRTRPMTSRTVLAGNAFQIPTTIRPDDLDWERSRPVKPWIVRRRAFEPPGYWDLEWIELSTTDVTNALCPSGKRAGLAQATPRKSGARGRSRPALERAQRVINEEYPRGMPDQSAEPNAILLRRIGQKLKEKGLPPVSDDTILRAAGRRK